MTHQPDGRLTRVILLAAAWSVALGDCSSSKGTPMDSPQLKSFGARYTAAWCSQNAASVAAFFSEGGSLQINQGTPSVGRAAITAAAQDFMTAFPDMVVTMDGVEAEYQRQLSGGSSGR